MPRISDKVAAWRKEHPGETMFSFEYFPPKTEAGVVNLMARIEKMGQMQPMWIDVTWGAGGSTADTTLSLCETAMDVTGLDVLMHLTCTNVTVDETRQVLQRCKSKGLCNILALRGDPPANAKEWTATEGGFSHAVDLVRFIRKEFGDYFCIGVAAYPEGHTDAESFDRDMQYYKEKVDAGADFGVTQLFYDTDLYFEFLRKSEAIGVPKSFDVFPGIMPIQNYAGFKRMTGFCKTFIPQAIEDALAPIQSNDDAVKKYGIELAVEMSKKLIAGGAPGIHLYTLNLETSAVAICEKLGLTDRLLNKEYPWKRSTGTRGVETTRPIFWAQRAKSYVERTQAWDEFPNGRFGNRDSPAFGLFQTPPKLTSESIKKLSSVWSFDSEAELRKLFVDFLSEGNAVSQLPWCSDKPGPETVSIRSQLATMCQHGMFTINSQARVNGALSSDALFGWGPANGVVYQKAYAEFFCSKSTLDKLAKVLGTQKGLSYMAVSKSGDVKKSAGCGPVTAVTWGVFPGQEIQQPTVVDETSFMVWKDEAFALWGQFEAVLPETSTGGRKAVQEIKENWYLVNVVDNNFLNGDLFNVLVNACYKQTALRRGA
jgi:methylenetetrahydrofolate reductase (NADPH)